VGTDGTLFLEGLVKTFGRKDAVRGVTFTMESGEVVGLLGPNGAGKTTVFYMVVGFIRPTAGRIWLGGKDISGLPMYKRARLGISYLPQEIGAFPFWQRPSETLSGTFILKGIAGHEERANELLEAVGLGGEDRPADQYSGGMKQKLRITQALSHAPRLLILDEPTTGLDVRERLRLLRVIERLRDRVDVILSTHHPEDVAAICDAILILHRGRVVASGSPGAVTATAGGRVYEVTLRSASLPAESEYEISAVGRGDGTLRLRVVGDAPAGARPVEPRLEDAYLLLTRD